MVSEADLKIGRKYIIHADWKADEPYCFPLYINRDGVADVSAAIVSYFHNLQAMREIVAGAIDKPTIFEYSRFGSDSATSSHRVENIEDTLLRNFLCG